MRRIAGRDIVKTLIIINVVIYVLCAFTGQRGVYESGLFQFMALHTPSVMQGQVWRLLTAQYLHWNVGHIFVNMLGLFFLGRALAMDWGTKQFIAVYTIAGLLGNVFYVTLTLVGWLPMQGVAAGASGCVLGLLGAAAVRYPHAEIWVYFLFPIKIRTAALIFAGLYVLNLFTRGENAGGDACHLAGLAFGAWWAFRGEYWWRRARFRMGEGRSSVTRAAAPTTFEGRVQGRREDAETIDRILKKVYEGGIHSLSEAEKQALQQATQRQRDSV